jgi:hypothetical protein
MSSLRVKIEINKGGVGVSLHKLAQVSLEYEKFLRSFSRDQHLDLKEGDWVAKDFENNSVEFIAEYIGPVTPDVVKESNAALGYIMDEKNEFKDLSTKISRATILQYARIAKDIDSDEVVEFEVFDNGDKPTPHTLSKQRSIEIEQQLKEDDLIWYSTSIQGKIHSLYKEVEQPHFYIRELSSNELIKCFYKNEDYDKIALALKNRDAIVHAAGWITASRATRKPISMKIEKLETAVEYQEGDIEKFFGCAPKIIEDDSVDELLDLMPTDE